MPQITNDPYGPVTLALPKGEVDLDTATVKVMLLNSTYVPDLDAHEFKSQLTGEITGTGYTAGGATLGTVTSVYDAVINQGQFKATDVTWANLSATFRYAVVYIDTGTATTSRLLELIDFGEDQTVTGETLLRWSPTGFLHLTA
jgi:hypothetical protein